MKPLIFALLLLNSFFLHSQPNGGSLSQIRHEIHWTEGLLVLDITEPLSTESAVLPENRLLTERMIDRSLSTHLREVLFDINVNSSHKVEDWVKGDPSLFRELENLRDQVVKELTTTEQGGRALRVRYTLKVFPDFIRLFFNHERTNPVPKVLGWVPTREFSGLVVFIPRPLRLWEAGQDPAHFLQSLFPRIYYQKGGLRGEITLLWSVEMVDPQELMKWGMAAFQEGFDEEAYRHRIGEDPLRIMARHLYGIRPTDIVITEEDARKIMAMEENRDLLKNGKVLFLLEPLP